MVGNLAKNSLDEIAVNQEMNELRRKMVNGEKTDACYVCYEKENSGLNSVRTIANEMYGHHVDSLIENTNSDGSLKTPWKMKHFNLRLSNLCNLSCRSCGPDFSSVISQEQNKSPAVIDIHDVRPALLDQEILKHLHHAESIVLVGGEPILSDRYWEILRYLIEIGNTEIKLVIFTNFSRTKYGDKNLFEYLKLFKNHQLMISLDGYGEKLELLRNGSDWNKIHSNIKQAKDLGINYKFHPTISAINVLHMLDLEKFLIESKLVLHENIMHNILVRPGFLNVKIFPLWFKDEVRGRIESHRSWLLSQGDDYRYLSDQWDTFIKFLYEEETPTISPDYTKLLGAFMAYNKDLDSKRQQNLFEVFPELLPVKNYHEQRLLS
jgi:MoaA/NifB/PqqE/SkfB family radical SAM enzyme